MKELYDELKNKYLSNLVWISGGGSILRGRITKVEITEGVITIQYISHSFKCKDLTMNSGRYYCQSDYVALFLDKLWTISLGNAVFDEDVLVDMSKELSVDRMLEICSKFDYKRSGESVNERTA